MGLIKVIVPDTVEQRFRRVAMQRFGYTKGSLSMAANKAFAEWSNQQEDLKNEIDNLGDPIEAVSGMLKYVKKSSVELQHEVGKIWSAKHARH